MRSLIIGRFQPFHNGHLSVVKEMSKKASYILICVGSAQESHTSSNPFTAGERISMIYNSISAEGIKNFFIIPIEDIKSNGIWVSKVETLCPKFDTVYSNNPLVKRLFSEKGYEIREAPFRSRGILSGTNIRKLMLSGKEWKTLVPEGVFKTIKEIGGVQRLKDISFSDKG